MREPKSISIEGLATPRMVSEEEFLEFIAASPDRAVSVAAILAGVDLDPAASRIHVISRDGSYSASVPLGDALGGGVLTSEAEGYRLRVIEGSTLCWKVKDVATLRLTATREPDSVPQKPTH